MRPVVLRRAHKMQRAAFLKRSCERSVPKAFSGNRLDVQAGSWRAAVGVAAGWARLNWRRLAAVLASNVVAP
jgi:hypothetical protein